MILDNDGSITGAAGDGVDLGATGTVTNTAGATISGNVNGLIDGATAVVINGGAISGTDGDGMEVGATANISNASTGVIHGGASGIIGDATTTLLNAGSISGTSADGVQAGATGNITNAAGASITGGLTGIVDGASAVVLNSGFVTGSTGDGVDVAATGSVTNTAGGILQGNVAGITGGATDIVVNAGNVIGTSGTGITLGATGTVTNAATGTVIGAVGILMGATAIVTNLGNIVGTTGDGVDLSLGGTLENAGSIAGLNNTAVYVGGTGTNTVLMDTGSVFYGQVVGGTGSNNILELGVGSGLITDFDADIINFQSITVDPGAHWVLTGNVSVPAENIVIGAGGSITYGGTTYGTPDDTHGAPSDDSAATRSSTPGKAAYAAPCFGAGTRISTRRGEIAVEDLVVGDQVITASGGSQPIVWIGSRKLDVSRHPRPDSVRPIRILADALAPGIPVRNLLLSPDHALYLEGHLIPAKVLVNGWNIAQLDVAAITYYHVELPQHAVLLAEHTPAESYLESDTHGSFKQAVTTTILHPDLAQTRREVSGCAPFLEVGALVERIRADILWRADISSTRNADLAIIYRDGAAVIGSRTAVPAEINFDPRDRRVLGVKIATMRVGGALVPLDHPDLIDGWYGMEVDGRWTDGAAVVPATILDDKEVVVTLAATMLYRVLPRAA